MFGARKMHVMRGRPEIAERHGAGHVARCTVERLMRDMGLHGVWRAKSPRTTRSAPKGAVPGRPGEPAFRRFQAERAVGGGHRAPRGAVRSGGDERASPPACRGGPVEAGGSPIPGTGVRAGSGPDNDGTHQYCQMVRARLARRRGIRRGTSG